MKTKLILSAIIAMSLTACGGGGGGGGDNPTPTTPAAKTAIKGKAIDGYIQGATVYLDMNFNKTMDAGEPSTITTNLGDYRMELNATQQACVEYVPLVVDVPVGAVDEDLGPVEEAYQMVLPPRFQRITDEDLLHITPLTTVLWTSVERELATEGALTCESVMADQKKREKMMYSLKETAKRMVAHYNIPEQQLYEDYIASGDTVVAAKAAEIVRGLQASFSASEDLKRQHPDAAYAYVDYHMGDYRDNDNAYPDAWYREEVVFWDDRTTSELAKVSDDFSQKIRVIGRSEQTIVTGADYVYSNGYGFESRGGDDSQYTCDIQETVVTTRGDHRYTLVNLSSGNAQVFEDCIPEDPASAVTHRYAIVQVGTENNMSTAQFVYVREFPFLADWVAMTSDVGTRDMSQLVEALEALPYLFEDIATDPTASNWNKSQAITDESGEKTTISYDSYGHHTKVVTHVDGTTTTECSNDGVTWGICS